MIKNNYDYIIVGCGIFGATFARMALDQGKKVLIIDKRNHIAGNCYTKNTKGIEVHVYGPHQFHTKNKNIWDFVNRFAKFNHFRSHIKAVYNDKVYSIPPNMILFNQLWGIKCPNAARKYVESIREVYDSPRNLEEHFLNSVGRQVYEMFFEGYTAKQWNKSPADIPVSTAKRIPIRYTWNDRYFDDPYEGIPIGGYTKMIENMIDGADIQLNVDYFENKTEWNKIAKKVVYTGKIDEFFDYKFGELEYRSLRFEEEILDQSDYQGTAIMNYTNREVPYTRIVEHKHFAFSSTPHTIITKEYPDNYDLSKIPYYPVNNSHTKNLYEKYKNEWDKCSNIIGGGRLFSFKYMDMDDAIGSAMALAKKEMKMQQ